jgi:hypothetical protein
MDTLAKKPLFNLDKIINKCYNNYLEENFYLKSNYFYERHGHKIGN